MKHKLDIEINAEGAKLVYLSPIEADGTTDGGFRLAGPKAWGGSKNIASFTITTDDLVRYINDYAPDVLAALEE